MWRLVCLILLRIAAVLPGHGLTQQGESNTRSWLYGYDDLGRLRSAEHGALNATNDAIELSQALASTRISWGLDRLGNWTEAADGYAGRVETQDLDGAAGYESLVLAQDHSTDLRNELLGIDVDSGSGPTNVEHVHDAAGNLVADGEYYYQYDAFNRLAAVYGLGDLDFDPDGVPESGTPGDWRGSFAYDALGRRISRQSPWNTSETEHRTAWYYYDGVRRIAEVFRDPLTGPPGGVGGLPPGGGGGGGYTTYTDREYVWGPDYVDECLWQVSKVGDVMHVLQDASMDAVATLDSAGAVARQWSYDPYGQPIVSEELATSAHNRLGHHGLFFDRLDAAAPNIELASAARGLYHNRNRTYEPRIGRFMTRDPRGSGSATLPDIPSGDVPMPSLDQIDLRSHYVDGVNVYGYARNGPQTRGDPLGLGAMDFLLPGPGDFITSMLSSLVGEYAANQEWDVEWATDWDQSDNWHTRGDNSWINFALARGLYDAFEIEIPFTDIGFNPLDMFAGVNPVTSPGSINVMAKNMQFHHIAANKGSWAKKFEDLFIKRAGFKNLNIPENIVPIPHGGRHSREYHQYVYKKLRAAVGSKTGVDAQAAIKAELARLSDFIRRNPHFVYNSAGGRPTGWRGMRDFVQFSNGRYRYRSPR